MGTILRQSTDTQNPTLPGGIYGPWISAGIPVYFRYDGTRTRFIILLCDGGRYGMSDLTLAEYKGVPLVDYRYHRGTFTKQIAPFTVSNVNTSTDVITTTLAHPFVNNDFIRFAVAGSGNLSSDLSKDLKYRVSDKTSTTFKVKTEDGLSYIDFTNAGTGQLIVWKADTGWDDAEQGALTYCPEFDSTFHNIAIVEGMLSAAHSHATNPPDWEDFRFAGDGRRLMDYDDEGNELGVINGETEEEIKQLSLVPLHVVDNFIVNYKGKMTRPRWASWRDMRDRAEVLIWQRVKTDQTGTAHGAIGRYYSDTTFTNLVVARNDLEINYNFGTTAPAPGMPITNYSIRWRFQQTFEFSETYTLKFEVDDQAKIYIDGVLIFTTPGVGTHTFPFNAVAERVYQVQIDFTQATATAKIIYKWSSASQAEQVVPSDRIFPLDEEVLRYGQTGFAFASPTEASEVHERLMERIIGWDWTEDNGEIVFLPPERAIAFLFKFDKIDDDSKPNFVYGSFKKRRRPLSDRRNFMIGRGRDAKLTGYPVFYRQTDRDKLRRLTNGEPSNDPAAEFGVCTPSMAERMLEMQMVLKSDPTHVFEIAGVRGSSMIRKNQFISVFYYDINGNFVANATGIITSHTWGAKNSRNDFIALPITLPFYTDEEVGEENSNLEIIGDGKEGKGLEGEGGGGGKE